MRWTRGGDAEACFTLEDAMSVDCVRLPGRHAEVRCIVPGGAFQHSIFKSDNDALCRFPEGRRMNVCKIVFVIVRSSGLWFAHDGHPQPTCQ